MSDTDLQRLREERRAWRERMRAVREHERHAVRQPVGDMLAFAPSRDGHCAPWLRRKMVNYAVLTVLLMLVNVAIGGGPWSVLPAALMAFDLFRDVTAEPSTPARGDPLLAAVPHEVLQGPHGLVVRDAVVARATILGVLDALSRADRDALPNISATAKGLVDRIIKLASVLQQLDRDASSEAMTLLDDRLATVRALPDYAPDRERRIALLERQRKTLTDLRVRRQAVAAQVEQLSSLVNTMKLELLRLRSSGLQWPRADGRLLTQEARAAVAGIERAIDAADDARKGRGAP